ncbi:MAG TPA: amidohydrolase family protein [Acidimicrobiales bacterium]
MSYATGRTVMDADSHLMELPDILDRYLPKEKVEQLAKGMFESRREILDRAVAAAEERRADQEVASQAEDRLLRDKGWMAMGGWDPEERSRVLDLLGFDAQLVFPTFAPLLYRLSNGVGTYAGADALNRAIADFCAKDRRLLAVASVSLKDPSRAVAAATKAIDSGCAAIMVPSTAPGERAPTHPDLDPFWEVLAESDTPFVLHVGGGGSLLDRAFHNNDMPVPDHLGGGENIRSKDYLAIHHSPAVFLGVLVLDGLFDRFPKLRGGCIEQGAAWVPSWIRHLDCAQRSFSRTEPPLTRLSRKPSEYVRGHLKFTPFPGEPVGWMIEQAGPELFMFSSDYPHPEGSTDPIAKFEATLDGTDADALDRFYSDNFTELMGSKLEMARA